MPCQRLVDAHETFKLTLSEADKEYNSIISLVNEVNRIVQQYGITGGIDNPYALITGQVSSITYSLTYSLSASNQRIF